MSHALPEPAVIRRAVADVVEFAFLSLEPRYLVWTPEANAALAALAWNAGHPRAVGARRWGDLPDPLMSELLDALLAARRTRWRDRDFLVAALSFALEGAEVIFYFDLVWEGEDDAVPCRTVVDVRTVAALRPPRGGKGRAAPSDAAPSRSARKSSVARLPPYGTSRRGRR